MGNAFLVSQDVLANAKTENGLSQEEATVYQQLGPIYQKIYLYAFNDEERHRTVVYINRGLNPYEAIDTILRTEKRSYETNHPKKNLSPAERAELNKSPHIDYK